MGRARASAKSFSMLAVFGAILLTVCILMAGPDVMSIVAAVTTASSFQVKAAGTGGFNTTMIVYGILSAALFLTIGRRASACASSPRRSSLVVFGFIMALFASLLAQLSSVSPELIRVSFSFLVMSCFFYCAMAEEAGKDGLMAAACAVAFYVFYFFITFVIGGSCGILPYVSDVLGVFA